MNPLQLTRSVRSLNRLRHIAKVLTQHGFGHIVAQVNLARFLPVWMLRKRRAAPRPDEGPTTIGMRLAQVCAELGPTFIKLGQLLSTRPDIVPPEALRALSSLQDDVPAFDPAIARETIAAELHRSAEECFARFDTTPIASGSVGQVHRARTRDGLEVVVKVRRPGIAEVIELDLHLLHWLADSAERMVPELQMYRPTMLVSELQEVLTRELDYVNEASATARFHRAFADSEGVRVPRVLWEHTAQRVLTLEALTGTNVAKIADGRPPEGPNFDRPQIARRIMDCFLRQVFELGEFHADPHPGNLLVTAPANVALIDFGQVGVLTDEWTTELIVIVLACVNREVGVVVDCLADMGALGPLTDRSALHRALQVMIDKYYGLPLKRFDLGTLFGEFSDVARRNDVVMPRDAALLIKTMGTVASVTNRLDPDLNLLELLKPRLKEAVTHRVSPSRLSREATLAGWHVLSMVRQAPGQLRSVLRRLSSGAWHLRVKHENLERLINELDRSSNRLAFSIVIAAIIVGSSVVLSTEKSITLWNIPIQALGIVGYVLAGVLGLGLTWAIFRSGRLH